MFQSWKLSHRVRICSRLVQSERAETVCVPSDSTKKGAVYDSAPFACPVENWNFRPTSLALWFLSAARRSAGPCRRRCRSRFALFRNCLRRCIQSAPVVSFRRGCRLGCGQWRILNQRAFALAHKGQLFVLAIPVNFDQITQTHLLGGEQVGQGIHDVAFNGSLQVTRSVPLVCPFLQKEVPRRTRHSKQKLPSGRLEHSLLHLSQFDFQNF